MGLGFRFSHNSTIVVSRIGTWCPNTCIDSTVRIYTVNDQNITFELNFTGSEPLERSHFRYKTLETPLVLTAGVEYMMTRYSTILPYSYFATNDVPNVIPDFNTFSGQGYYLQNSHAYPSSLDNSHLILGDFEYSAEASDTDAETSDVDATETLTAEASDTDADSETSNAESGDTQNGYFKFSFSITLMIICAVV